MKISVLTDRQLFYKCNNILSKLTKKKFHILLGGRQILFKIIFVQTYTE